jgi:group I intron endonuclease
MGCIYAFIDRKGKIFYIGQTINLKGRISGHKLEVDRQNHLWKYNKLRKEIRETGRGIKSFIKILEDNINKKDLDSKEIYHIRRLRTKGYKLTNLTDGGKGSSTYTPALQKRCAKSRIGGRRSEETRRKISEARMGMKFSKKHKKNLSIARKKRVTTEETRKKMSESSKGKINIGFFKLIDPNGRRYTTTEGLTKFCEEHGLCTANIHMVIQGKRKHHKGWVAKRIK